MRTTIPSGRRRRAPIATHSVAASSLPKCSTASRVADVVEALAARRNVRMTIRTAMVRN
ncbi:MAG: hypothetical protein RMJ55_14280 [Roseiflexaceae bacterium]|nr:hypothetical protein [Roseiflexaceae bacterium]